MKKKAPIKISLLGLDNAGKTTILHVLSKTYNFEEEVKELAPTIQIKYHKRVLFDQALVFWDFGGQERFRAAYLNDPFYFLGLNALIFVIDIQDEMRFPIAIDYLSKILDILQKDTEWIERKEPIHICFSKVDFNLISENRIDYESRMNMLEELICRSFVGQKFKFYATSIYNLYSIVHLVSHSVQSYLKFTPEILHLFEDLQKSLGFTKALVYDHTGIVIAESDNTPVTYSSMDNTIHTIIGHHLRIFRQLEENDMHVKQTWDTDGTNSIFNIQFCLYDPIPLTSEKKETIENIKKERELINPYYQNYYFSLFIPKEKQKEGEKIIPDVVHSIRSILKKQFEL